MDDNDKPPALKRMNWGDEIRKIREGQGPVATPPGEARPRRHGREVAEVHTLVIGPRSLCNRLHKFSHPALSGGAGCGLARIAIVRQSLTDVRITTASGHSEGVGGRLKCAKCRHWQVVMRRIGTSC